MNASTSACRLVSTQSVRSARVSGDVCAAEAVVLEPSGTWQHGLTAAVLGVWLVVALVVGVLGTVVPDGPHQWGVPLGQRGDVQIAPPQPGGRPHLPAEPLHHVGPVHELRADDLEGDGAAHETVLRLVHRPHAAGPQ